MMNLATGVLLVGFMMTADPTSRTGGPQSHGVPKMPKTTYRVMYNYDSGPIFEGTGPARPAHVEQMVDEVAEGGADVLLICACDQRTYYPSKVWQTHWEGFEEGDRSFFGSIPKKTLDRRMN